MKLGLANIIQLLTSPQIISTWFYLGKIKFMPGTWGSLGAFPLLFLLHSCLDTTSFVGKYSFLLGLSTLIGLIYWLGHKATKAHLTQHYSLKSDPGEIVVDEVVGQLITCLIYCGIVWGHEKTIGSWNHSWPLFLGKWPYFLPALVAFRFFDIVKVWPISIIDQKVKGPHGVMLDDVLAGIFAGLSLYFCDVIQTYLPILKI